MRISGLATGMDTEQIIKDMMKAHRLPMEKVTQKKQYTEWQLDDYRSVNRNLRDAAYKITDTMGLRSTFMQKSVNISNPDAVGIKSTNATGEFSGTIEVTQLAKQASLQSGTIKAGLSQRDVDSVKLSELGIGTIDDDLELVIQAPNSKKPGRITITSQDTIGSVLQKINKDPDAGVTAFYDAHTGKIALTAKESGVGPNPATETQNATGNILIDGAGGDLLKLKGSTEAPTDETAPKHTKGQNAEFTFNGLKTERGSNTFTINGFEVTLKQLTAGTEVTFSSAPDTDKILESVVKFVDDYNKMIDELNEKLREPKYRDFQPLSDEQKKEMKEKEIELWEEKAKSGTLRNDPTIANMLTSLRQAISGATAENAAGETINLEKVGIKLIQDFKANGKLEINEDTLRKTITEDPNLLYELFAKPASETDKNGGVAIQFRKIMDDTRKVISAKAGTTGTVSDSFTLGRSLKSMNQQIERFEDRLKMIEDRYWKQFTAMEKAIQRANAQSANMMNMFGGQ